MIFKSVCIESFGYVLPPIVVTSEELERRIEPVYRALHLKVGQLEALTGIYERRFWEPGFKMSTGAIEAGKKAIQNSNIDINDIGMLIYGGVCRDLTETATSNVVSAGLNLGPNTIIYDVSNACLGVINGLIQVATSIELGQIKAGLVVSSESCREIIDSSINRMLKNNDLDVLKKTIATFTGGSGSVAVLLSSSEISGSNAHKIQGYIALNSSEHHELCTWSPDTGIPSDTEMVMNTDSVAVLKHGVDLGRKAFENLKKELSWSDEKPDKLICHQVGSTNQKKILEAIGISKEREFVTYPFLGNIGTVSLPITAALAEERGFLQRGDTVGFLGIGSGLNCLFLGVNW